MSTQLDALTAKIKEIIGLNKRIGVMVSGGLDSTLLLYLVASYFPKFGKTLVAFTVPRTDDSIVHAERVVKWVEDTFNMQIERQEVGDPTLFHSRQVNSGVEQAVDMAEIVLLGDTWLPTVKLKGSTPIRYENKHPKVNQIYLKLKFNKIDTVSIANELGLHSVFTLSHTCTQSKDIRCSNCWQCSERAWAFEQLELTDPGEM